MPERPRIALLVESSRDYGRGLLQGIAAYARAHGPWSLYHLERSLGDPAPSRLKEWARDGIIARIESRQLLKPIGMMTCNDFRAQQVLNCCGSCGIAVPDEVAVVGVDNDEMVCELCTPSLSSVRLNTHAIGYQAAAVLHHMLRGVAPPQGRILVESPGVVVRQSTQVLVVEIFFRLFKAKTGQTPGQYRRQMRP